MADYGSFKVGAIEFPLAATPFVGAREKLDPPINGALAYFQAMLEKHMGAYFDALATQVGAIDLVGKVVAETVGYDPAPYLKESNFKFPLLAMFRTTEEHEDFTTSWYRTKSVMTVLYVLPPLDVAKYASLVYALRAARTVILDRTMQGYDPDYNAGEEVWETAGIAQITVDRARYGMMPSIEGNLSFPAVEISFTVDEQEDISPNLDDFDGIDATICVSDGDPANDVPVVEIAWDNVTP